MTTDHKAKSLLRVTALFINQVQGGGGGGERKISFADQRLASSTNLVLLISAFRRLQNFRFLVSLLSLHLSIVCQSSMVGLLADEKAASVAERGLQ